MSERKPKRYHPDKPLRKPLSFSPTATLRNKVEDLSLAMEKMKLAEYVQLLNKPVRLLYINFISGIARGVGMAVGFAILGALMIYILKRLAILNLPVIGGVIADLVRIVQVQLKVGE